MSFDESEPLVPAKTPPPAKAPDEDAAGTERRVPSSALSMTRFTPTDLSTEWTLKGCETLAFKGRDQPVLGRYLLIRKIAEGGMGAVYYGSHLHLGTEVAIKILLPNLQAQQSDVVDRFFREARLAAQIHSPHLVRVLDVAHDETLGTHFLVMEYVQGESAGAWLERLRTETGSGGPERIVLDVVIAATRGLTAAHRENVIHRDVKPANILLPGDDEDVLRFAEAKLSDLGLARPDTGDRHLTDGELALGTPGFMAPEQTKDAKNVGKAADVFAMGATLYALLTGDSPFRGTTPFEMLRATVDGSFTPLSESRPDVTAATCAVVAHCLAKDAADRPADADALLAALLPCREALDDGESPTAVLPPIVPSTPPAAPPADVSPPPAVQPEASRRRLSLLPVYVSAAMLLVFALATAFLGSGDRAPGEDPEPEPAIPAPADPEGEIGRVVTAFGEFLLNERPTRLAQDMPLAIDYGADLSTREAEIVFESVTGDRIEIGADTGVRATRSPLGVETLVLKWGTVEAELSARTHLSFRRFGTLQPSAGEKARVVVVAPREDTALGRRVAARSGDVLLSSRTLSVSIPDSATVTFFNDPGEDRRRRELRFKSEGPATREVRFRYPLNAGEVVVVASAGSSGTITMEGRAKLRVLNSPASPAGTEIRVETVRRGEREVRATIPPGRSAAIPLRRGPGNGRGENR